jgi:hypothetical protein
MTTGDQGRERKKRQRNRTAALICEHLLPIRETFHGETPEKLPQEVLHEILLYAVDTIRYNSQESS